MCIRDRHHTRHVHEPAGKALVRRRRVPIRASTARPGVERARRVRGGVLLPQARPRPGRPVTPGPPDAGARRMTSSSPRVSIGLPVHDGERYLRTTIDSIRAQTFTDFEPVSYTHLTLPTSDL